ncbi:MAG: adenylate/guanylate cyclase domain-containing protein [Chloroflexota bacterium]|nr:adenylate/guanylate cyclase domain-containing protein [Chloroflexota bacterium]
MKKDIRILIIDDSQEIREFVKNSILEPEGYQVLSAVDGREGVEKAIAERPDLLLLDYELPYLNGIEVLHELQKQQVAIPTILITSYGSESVAVEVFRLGVRDYVPKPFTVDRLLSSIEKVFRSVRLKQERDNLMLQLQTSNEDLNQRLRELDTLYHVSKSVALLGEPEELWERIVSAALYLTDAMDGALVLRDPQTGKSTVRIHKQRSGATYAQDETHPNIMTQASNLMMAAPLKVGDKVLGALTVSNKRNRERLTPHDKRLLDMLADYAAIAIANSRLLAEVEERRQRENREIRNLFEHYVAPPVVKRILQRPNEVRPGGQRQNISVLFADLRGFTTFSAQTPPEILIQVLNQHIAAATEVLLEMEGTLDKFMGDEIMAFFNAPLPQPHYALQAVKTAVHILKAIRKLHPQILPKYRLDFGIGIYTGEAIVGNIGTDKLVNFTVVGPTVNKAHALQELAPARKILICQHTYKMVKEYLPATRLPTVKLKGQSEPEPIYEIALRED